MRIKIAFRNLVISQLIIFIFLIFAYFTWFPYSFSKLGGFHDTALMLIFVDLILGPLLVFLIYKENKKYLKFDINVLLSIQLIAFIFGAYSLFLKHPAYAVFSVDRFVLTNVSKIYPQQTWSENIKRHFFNSTDFVIANFPTEIKKRSKLINDVVFNGQPDIDSRPKYFSPLDNKINLLMEKGMQLEDLTLDTLNERKLSLFMKKHIDISNNLIYFPLSGNNKKDVLWVFNKTSGKPLGIIDIDPWSLMTVSNLEDK